MPHKSTGFSPNYIVYGRELFILIEVTIEQPDSSEVKDELEYVQGLRNRLEDAYDIAREHLEKSAFGRRDTMMCGRMRNPMNLVT